MPDAFYLKCAAQLSNNIMRCPISRFINNKYSVFVYSSSAPGKIIRALRRERAPMRPEIYGLCGLWQKVFKYVE